MQFTTLNLMLKGLIEVLAIGQEFAKQMMGSTVLGLKYQKFPQQLFCL
jgi:hypothetical protein